MKGGVYRMLTIQIPGNPLLRILAETDTRTVGNPVLRQFGDVWIQ